MSKGGDNTQTAEEEKGGREKYRRDTRFVSYGLNVESSGKSQCAFCINSSVFQCFLQLKEFLLYVRPNPPGHDRSHVSILLCDCDGKGNLSRIFQTRKVKKTIRKMCSFFPS